MRMRSCDCEREWCTHVGPCGVDNKYVQAVSWMWNALRCVTRGVAAMRHIIDFTEKDDHVLTEEEEAALEQVRVLADAMPAEGGDADEVLGD